MNEPSVIVRGHEEAVELLDRLASGACSCDPDEPDDEPCDRCLAMGVLIRVSRRRRGTRATLLLREIKRLFVGERCLCSFPEAGETGVIVCTSCDARAVIHLPACTEHQERALRCGGTI